MSGAKKPTKVQFTLSRDLTWAEREAFNEYVTEDPSYYGHRFLNARQFVIYSKDDSRYVGNEIHTFFGTQLVNVYLAAIHTLYPKVRV